MRKRLSWRTLWILAGILAASLLIGLTFRTQVLTVMGRILTVDEVTPTADMIVVPEWAGRAGALEAADLVHARVSPRVAVLSEPSRAPELELIRRQIAFQTDANNIIQLLKNLGVTDVIGMTESADGTESEGRILPIFCKNNGIHSIVVVSTPDHSRRVRRVLRRSMRAAGASTQIVVKSARFAAFVPDAWWQTRDGTRTEIIELEKLTLDILRHPIS